MCALCVNMISSRMVGRMYECVCVYVAVLLKQYQRIWNRLSFGSLQFINFDWGSFFRRISLFAMNRYLFEMCVFVHMLICDRIIDFFFFPIHLRDRVFVSISLNYFHHNNNTQIRLPFSCNVPLFRTFFEEKMPFVSPRINNTKQTCLQA